MSWMITIGKDTAKDLKNMAKLMRQNFTKVLLSILSNRNTKRSIYLNKTSQNVTAIYLFKIGTFAKLRCYGYSIRKISFNEII